MEKIGGFGVPKVATTGNIEKKVHWKVVSIM